MSRTKKNFTRESHHLLLLLPTVLIHHRPVFFISSLSLIPPTTNSPAPIASHPSELNPILFVFLSELFSHSWAVLLAKNPTNSRISTNHRRLPNPSSPNPTHHLQSTSPAPTRPTMIIPSTSRSPTTTGPGNSRTSLSSSSSPSSSSPLSLSESSPPLIATPIHPISPPTRTFPALVLASRLPSRPPFGKACIFIFNSILTSPLLIIF